MISIIITSFKEPKTIGRAIEAFLEQKLKNYELIVVAPDNETLNVAKKYAINNKEVKWIKDPGKGKPVALNTVMKKARGKILVLTDGDVKVGNGSVNALIEKFNNEKVGGVSGKVESINKKDEIYGFWAYILTEGFHKLREREQRLGKKMVGTGYLYAIKKSLIGKLPKDVLADDAFISQQIYSHNHIMLYSPEAKVYVKYPDNLIDWIRQKKRTAGRLYQFSNKNKNKIESMFEEAIAGIKTLLLIHSIKELFWFMGLIVMRLYIWFRVFFDFRLWKRSFGKVWERVESTKG